MAHLIKQALLVCVCLFVLSGQAMADSLSDAEAVKLLTPLAEQGDAVAQYKLSAIYADGKIVSKDLKAALYWLEKAALAGQPNAQTSLGWAYMSDYFELAPDYQLAMKWNLKAANQGFGEGSANIGLLYEKGWGVSVNYIEAANWYKKAIGQGAKSDQAELQLAGLYENGLGVQKNPIEAAYLYRIIAERKEIEQAKQLNQQGFALYQQGKYQEAIALNQRALTILKNDHIETAKSLTQLGLVYQALHQNDKALPLLQRALEINEKVLGSENPVTAMSSSILAKLYEEAGQYDKALPILQSALEIQEKTIGPDHPVISGSLVILAGMYQELGQYDKALPLYQRALVIDEKVLGSKHTSITLNLIKLAMLYERLGQYDKALPLYQRALVIREKSLGPDHNDTAESITYLAMFYIGIGKRDEALPLQRRALSIYEKTLDSGLPDSTNDTIYLPLIYLNTIAGQNDKTLPLLQRAYRAALNTRNPKMLNAVQGYLGAFYEEQGNPAVAIFYLKGAVNIIQSLRTGSRGLDKNLQESFMKTNEAVYKKLADLLIDTGRLTEAQQVLSMLKEDEYFDFIRRDAQADNRSTRMNYSGAERPFVEWLEKLGNDGAALVDQLNSLNKQAKLGLTPEQEQQRTRIKDQLAEQTKQTIALLNDIAQQLPATKKQQMTEAGKENLDQLRATLTSLGHGAILLNYIVTEKRVHILLTTAKVLLVREAEISAKELNRKIAEFRRVLQNPARDPRPQAQALYQLLIAPVADDLKQAQAQTLMLSLDGSLRYLPMGALHDGKAYLAERYPLAMYTEVAKGNLRTQPEAQWKVAGLGITRKIGEFAPLPSVQQELDGIIHVGTRKAAGGVLPGDIYLDEAFTQIRLHDVLDRAYPVLHIASHFVFIPGTEAQSFLLLGDGKQLTLAELRTGGWKFGSVDMMTLSACETALGGGHDENGREIEGFGALVQRQGAKGVLATLWPVADQSTAILMQTLYRLRQEKGLTKADALREAQLALISGKHIHPAVSRKTPITSSAGAGTANAPVYTPDPARPYAHPYYWAPFILMGNWL